MGSDGKRCRRQRPCQRGEDFLPETLDLSGRFGRVTRRRDGSALPYLALRPVADPLHQPAIHPPQAKPNKPQLSHTPGAALMCEQGTLVCGGASKASSANVTLNLHPRRTPARPSRSGKQRQLTVHLWDCQPNLLTVAVHPLGAAEKQWSLLSRERQNCSASSRKAYFHSRFRVQIFVKTEATFLSGRTTVDKVYDDYDIQKCGGSGTFI